MRLAKIENYHNPKKIVNVKVPSPYKLKMAVALMNEKDVIKMTKTIEKIARASQEYKDYVAYLRDVVDMTECSFFSNVSNKSNKKISIEIHHEPFTLYDIAYTVLNKCIAENRDINPIELAEEVMEIHYKNMVGLIPLSKTPHKLVHLGRLFIPLQCVYGGYIRFLEEYDAYIPQDIKGILEAKLKMSKELASNDMSILETKYVYLEVEGFNLPQIVEETA